MELKDSMFWSDNPKYQRIWGDETYFPYLLKNLEMISNKFSIRGIKKVVIFDELGLNWEDWERKDALTLCIMPICNMVDQMGSATQDWLRRHNIPVREKLMPVDIVTQENVAHYELVTWFRTRNIIVAHINPFLDETVFNKVWNELGLLEVKFLTQEQIWEIQLTEQWQVNLDERAKHIERDIRSTEDNAENYRNNYMDCVRAATEYKRQVEEFKNGTGNITAKIKTELGEVSKMLFVKRLLVRDKIYLNFGDIYITGRIVTGKTEDGRPKIEQQRVYIGEIEFVIGAGEITLVNKKQLPGCNPHPHASPEGGMCFGAADLEARRYLNQLDLIKLAKLLYAWVFSYNDEGGPYQRLQEFYKADQERVKLTQEGMQRAIDGEVVDPEGDEDFESDEPSGDNEDDEQES